MCMGAGLGPETEAQWMWARMGSVFSPGRSDGLEAGAPRGVLGEALSALFS